MSETENIDFNQYEWQDNVPKVGVQSFLAFTVRTNYLLKDRSRMYMYPSYEYVLQAKPHPNTYLIDVAKRIGIDDEASQQSLQLHGRRINRYITLHTNLNLLFLIIAAGFVVWIIAVLGLQLSDWIFDNRSNIRTALSLDSVLFVIIAVLIVLNILAVANIVERTVTSIMNRFYADSVVVSTALAVTVELMQTKALSTFSSRRRLQERMSFLSKHLLLLSLQYKSESEEDDRWIASHFKSMERYVREHERMVVAPKANSLEVLRKDFYQLAKILISGWYGEFHYEYQESNVPPQARSNRILRGILGFVGFAIPSIILYMLYTNPGRIASMGIDINTVTLIALAWFLLTIDAALKLGIVERITGLAKAIRDRG